MAVASHPVDDVSVRSAGELAFGALPTRVRTCAHRGYGYPHLSVPYLHEPARWPLGGFRQIGALDSRPVMAFHEDVALPALDERGVAGWLAQAPVEAAPLSCAAGVKSRSSSASAMPDRAAVQGRGLPRPTWMVSRCRTPGRRGVAGGEVLT
jgi:hypothetical protein